jgi:hypothetical protein
MKNGTDGMGSRKHLSQIRQLYLKFYHLFRFSKQLYEYVYLAKDL